MAAIRLGGAGRLLPRSTTARVLLLLLVVFLPTLFAQAAMHYSRYVETRAHEFQNNLEVAGAVAGIFDGFVKTILSEEEATGRELAASDGVHTEEASRLLAIPAKEHPAISPLSWASPQGRIVASGDPNAIDANVSQTPFFQQILLGREWVVSDLALEESSGKATFVIARGIRDERGILLGVMVATIDPQRLGEVLAIRRGGQGAVVIIDSRGFGVYRYPEVAMDWEQRDWVKTRPIIAEALAGREVVGTFTAANGQQRIGGYAPIRSIGWVASASRTEQEAMAPVLEDITREVAVLLLVTLVALLVALLISRSITSPLRRLRNHAIAIKEGNLGQHVGVAGPAEVATLAVTLNRMTDALQSHEQKLQAQNEELQSQQEELHAQNEELQAQAEEMRSQDEELQAQNEELRAANEALAKSERALAESQKSLLTQFQQFTTIFDSLNAIVYVADMESYELLFMNSYGTKIFGEQSVGKSCFRQLQAGQAGPCTFCTNERLVREGIPLDPYVWEGQNTLTDRWLLCIDRAIRWIDGRLVRMEIAVDINERKQAEQMREGHLRAISHDLRNPLSIIQGHAQVLQLASPTANLADRVARSAQAIKAASQSMNKMIQDLVDTARLESGKLTLNPRPIDLLSLIVGLLQQLAGIAGAGRIGLELPEALPPVLADPDRVERILMNLLSNALKYAMPEGAVTIAAKERDRDVVISVSDTGRGIPADELSHVFEQYYRGKEVRERREGLGLGLYITKGLVEAHGGHIWVESEVEKGSTFHLSLPLA